MNRRILFTGGGSAGHVTPNLAIIELLQKNNVEVFYIGSHHIEKKIISDLKIPFYEISSGKLRRYLSFKNFIDVFKILWGIIQAYFIIFKIRPKIIFSKGGFVSFPVVLAGFLHRIPIIVHEADYTPGLANKLCFPFSSKICLTYAESEKFIRYKNKVEVTGLPVRHQFFSGNKENGLKFLGFTGNKPILLIIGGSLGSEKINSTIRILLDLLLTKFDVVHLCGKGKKDETSKKIGYVQIEYLNHEIYDVMTAADLIISRSGANAVYELIAVKKPAILIPLSKKVSRGDQIENADFVAKKGLFSVLYEENLSGDSLFAAIDDLLTKRESYLEKLRNYNSLNSTKIIYTMLINYLEN